MGCLNMEREELEDGGMIIHSNRCGEFTSWGRAWDRGGGLWWWWDKCNKTYKFSSK